MKARVTTAGIGPSDQYVAIDEVGEASTPTLPIGFLIAGKYAIKKVLGSGGDGVVYEGEHSEIGHLVAIKVAHRKRADREDIMQRFRREARICGSLRHPHVGQIYDVGKLDDGSPYMVMELQQGRSLADVLDETLLPIEAVLNLTCQLLEGLGAAHRAGIIHRDVKPDNVMLVRDRPGDVIVKLVDFGISKSVEPQRDTHVTGEGVIVGSPDYMPPEQVRGDTIDFRTDIYAVGVLMYETLTQRLPFEADTLADLVAAILRDELKPPSSLRPDCPPMLERIVLKAMARDPARRYQSVDQLLRALTELQVGLRSPSGPNLALLNASLSEQPVVLRTRRKQTVDTRVLKNMAHRGGLLATRRQRLRMFAAALALLGAALMWRAAMSNQEPRVTVNAARALRQTTEPVVLPTVVVAPPAAAAQVDERVPPAGVEIAAPQPVHEEPPQEAVEVKSRRGARKSGSGGKARASTAVSAAPVAAPAAPDPQIPALLKDAGTAFVRGDVSGAYAMYKQVLARAPQQADAWRGLGMTSARLDKRAEAVRAFQRYLQLRPGAPDSERIRQQLEKVQ